MAGNLRHVINMANSIVGVSILSMPFCFKETGIVLGIILVLLSGFITKKTCMFLIRSAIMARRRSYEFLAFHVFGVSGKLFVELCMILFLVGICISFHVVIGDLAPAIVARIMSIENSSSLRCTLLIGILLLVILPLCLLRNLDSLASMSACSIGFYFFLITVTTWHAFPKLWDGSWYHIAELWQPAGALQILPIFSLALACQSNVFEIYDSVPDPDVPKMRSVVNHAVNLCSALYISVGFLGYVAFVDKDLSGNLIMNFPNTGLTEGIKVFFTVSLAISFPLMIFPCRTSIHSLLYRRSNPSSFDLVGNYMPEARFKGITFGILTVSVIFGILIPNIEFVLGLLGSTMGMLIALILPSLLFIKVNSKASNERLLAQGIMLMGVILIVTGTYFNVAHIYEVQVEQQQQQVPPTPGISKMSFEPNLPNALAADNNGDAKIVKPAAVRDDSATRKEPVAPEPPPEERVKKNEIIDSKVKDKGTVDLDQAKKSVEGNENVFKKDVKETKVEKIVGDTLHPDAIQKEEKENKEEDDGDKKKVESDIEKKQSEILEKIQEQHKEQQKILEEQKVILKALQDQKEKQEETKKQDEIAAAAKADVVNAGPVDNANNVGMQPVVLNPAPGQALPQNPVVPVEPNAQTKDENVNVNRAAVPVAGNQAQVLSAVDPKSGSNYQVQQPEGQPPPLVYNLGDNQRDAVAYHPPGSVLNSNQQNLDKAGNAQHVETNANVPAKNSPIQQVVIAPADSILVGPDTHVVNPAPGVVNVNPAAQKEPAAVLQNKADGAADVLPNKADSVRGQERSDAVHSHVAGESQSEKVDPPVKPVVSLDAAKVDQNLVAPQDQMHKERLTKEVDAPKAIKNDPLIDPEKHSNAADQVPKAKNAENNKMAGKKQNEKPLANGKSSHNQVDSKKISKVENNVAHDEERRKRDVDHRYSADFPDVDLLKDVNRRDADFAYDTRHLLWTGRSRRRRKRGQDRYGRDDYPWDET